MADAATLPDRPPPWGYLATAGWALLAMIAYLLVPLAGVALRYGLTGDLVAHIYLTDQWLSFAVTAIGTAVAIGVLALAARLRGWKARDYLGLVLPSRHYVLIAVAVVLAILASDLIVTDILGAGLPASQVYDYTRAKSTGTLPLWWIDLVLLAPLSEEIMFRGLLQRGWVRSDHGAIPGIVIISVLWTALHVGFEWLHLASIFFSGLLLGWVRWRSGSTLLTITVHALVNLEACFETSARIEGWFS